MLTAVQANVRGAAYIMDPSITLEMTVFAEADTEGKSCDGDITPTALVSTDPSWKNHSDPLALPSSPLNMRGARRRHWGK